MIRLFAGFEPMESIGYAVFCHSVISRSSRPVAITAVDATHAPRGTNAFTLSRFLVPWLCDFKGHAIFADGSDMLCLADLAELDALFDPAFAVQVVKHPDYLTKHPRKYVGTSMECVNSEYARKNWASLMIVNCEHDYWEGCNPELLNRVRPIDMLQFKAARDEEIGALPSEWNVLADEGQYQVGAKILHMTAGLPENCAEGHEIKWWAEHGAMNACATP